MALPAARRGVIESEVDDFGNLLLHEEVNKNKNDIESLSNAKANNNVVAEPYTSSKSYVVGEYLIKDNVLYKVKANCINVTPPSTNYYEVVSALSDVNTRLNGLNTLISGKADKSLINNNSISKSTTNTSGTLTIELNGNRFAGLLLIVRNGKMGSVYAFTNINNNFQFNKIVGSDAEFTTNYANNAVTISTNVPDWSNFIYIGN